jgi:hypothetical protein
MNVDQWLIKHINENIQELTDKISMDFYDDDLSFPKGFIRDVSNNEKLLGSAVRQISVVQKDRESLDDISDILLSYFNEQKKQLIFQDTGIAIHQIVRRGYSTFLNPDGLYQFNLDLNILFKRS